MTTIFHLSAGHGISPRGFWYSWAEELLIVVTIFGLVAAYVTGRSRLRQRSSWVVFPEWRTWRYSGWVLAFVIAMLSPVAAYSEDVFAVHMIQHRLLLLGAPLVRMLWALPASARNTVSCWLRPGRYSSYFPEQSPV